MNDFEVIPIDEEGPSIIDELPTEDTDEEPVIDDVQDDPSVPEGGEPESTEEAPEPEPDVLFYASEVDEIPTEETYETPVVDDEPYGGEPYEPDINQNIVSVPIVGTTAEEQQVLMMVRDGSPIAMGSVGSGDRVMSMADDAVTIANEAAMVAEVTGQHFWQRSDDPDDDGAGTGAFVTEDEQDSFTAAAAIGFPDLGDESESISQTDTFVGDGENTSFELSHRPVSTTVSVTVDGVQVSDITVSEKNIIFETAPANESAITATYDRAKKPWHNLLMNSLGILLRSGTRNLASLTKSAIAFFDGTGNSASNITAVFGKDGSQVGPSSKVHSMISAGGFALKDRNDTAFVDFRLANDDSTGTVNVVWEMTADGDTDTFTFRSDIVRVINVKLDGTTQTTGWTLSGGNSVVFSTAPAAGTSVEIIVETHEPNPVMTFGTRNQTADAGLYSRVLGIDCEASGYLSHAEGFSTKASYDESHAEGYQSVASGWTSHAEGIGSTASAGASHAEGLASSAIGDASHAEGRVTVSGGTCSHAEGKYSLATGENSHAQNLGTIAAGENQTAIGRYNVIDQPGTYAAIVGNGTAANSRSNALTVDWGGDVNTSGNVTVAPSSSLDTTAADNGITADAWATPNLRDKNNRFVGHTYGVATPAGLCELVARATNNVNGSNVTNDLRLRVAKNGTRSVAVSDANIWRTAIGLGNSAVQTFPSTEVSLANNAKVNLCSVSLAAGVWLVTAGAVFNANSAGDRLIHVTTTSEDAGVERTRSTRQRACSAGTTSLSVTCLLNLTSTSTVYLVGLQTSGSSIGAKGGMYCWRIK